MEGDGDGVATSTKEPPLHPSAGATSTTPTPTPPLPPAAPSAPPDLMDPGAAPSSSPAARPQSTVAGLAKEAAQLFHARSYQGCLLILHQLQLHNDEDPKEPLELAGSSLQCAGHLIEGTEFELAEESSFEWPVDLLREAAVRVDRALEPYSDVSPVLESLDLAGSSLQCAAHLIESRIFELAEFSFEWPVDLLREAEVGTSIVVDRALESYIDYYRTMTYQINASMRFLVQVQVRHNIAVAEYYRDGCTNPHKLLEVLSQVKARSEELARAAEEQLEGNSSASTSGSINGSGGNGGLSSGIRSNSAEVVAYMEDYDTSIPNLNNAMMMYNLQRYADAKAVLEPLYRNIEPIDETAALRVCLLMLDITLASGQPGKSAEVLQYMEKAFGYLLPPAETPNTAPSLPSSTPSETESLITSTEQALARTSSDEGLEEDSVTLGSLEIDSGQNLGSKAPVTPVIAAREKPIPPVDVKLLLHLYRGRLFLSARNLKVSKREIKSALNLSRENTTALLLKAQLEYSRGNYKKATKQLTLCIGRADSGMRGMLLNNLGCIHHRMGKHHVSAAYFRNALSASERSGSLSVPAFSQDKSLAILYNTGLQLLTCGKPDLAFRCFQGAAALYFNRPLLWLRLAECCILALEKGLLDNTTTTKVKVTVVGEGVWRRLVLPGGSLNPTVVNRLKLDESEGDEQMPDNGENWFVTGKPFKLSLSFAIQCLQTGICLFDRFDAKAAEAAAEAAVAATEVKDGDDSQSSKGGGSTPTGEAKDSKGLLAAVAAIEEQSTQETAALRMWALAAISYCQLGVGHPLRALRSAEELLRQPSCVRPYLLLGHVYAAEALCQLGRPQEALEHLSTCLNETTAEPTNAGTEDESQLKWKSGDNSEASGDGEDSAAYTVGTLGDAASIARLTGTNARASLYINLASVYAMEGNFQEAQRLAQLALAMTPRNPMAMLAAVFVELKLERMGEALALLKQYRHLCSVSPCKGLSQH